MKKEELYSDATIEEFLEACEISELDEIFYELSTEAMKRNAMITKSLTEYLKTYNTGRTKYDTLRNKIVA